MIIGNKCDLEDKRVIPIERGQEVAQHHGIPFIETSAKTNVNIKRAFDDITYRILEKQPEKKPEPVGGSTQKPIGLGTPSSSTSSYMKPNCC